MKKHFFRNLLAVVLLVSHLPLSAEDIDLFVGLPPSGNDLPNVLLLLDNAANFSAAAGNCTYNDIDHTAPSLNGTAGGIEQCALYNVVDALPVEADGSAKMNLGLMAYNATSIRDINNANCGGKNGGCLMVPLMPMNTTNKEIFKAWVKTWKTTGGAGDGYIKADSEQTGAGVQETWAYYAGATGLSGRDYASIKPASGCQKNFVVFVANAFTVSGTPGDGGNASPAAALSSAPGVTAAQKILLTPKYESENCGTYTIPSSAHEAKGFYGDEWSRYMHQTDIFGTLDGVQNITTYTVGLVDPTKCKADYPALLNSMAGVGGGKYFETDGYQELVDAITRILGEIQSVNSVFAAVSLPVSVNTQGTYLNQVFIGMFRPDEDALPRWAGNLKQYKLGFIGGELKTLDADGEDAINYQTGFISECALSYWTPTALDTYWTFRPMGGCPTIANSDVSNYPDGNIVEKGAQAYKLRSLSSCSGSPASCTLTARNVKTCDPDSCTALVNFSSTYATQVRLGAADTTERDNLINWAKGLDVQDENPNGETTTDMRPSAHGDVVHSRPVAINYGTADSPQVVVFYGSNDGVLHAINGNRLNTDPSNLIGSGPAGSELWAFIPPEFYPNIKRIYDNDTQISYKGNATTSPAPLPKPYGLDGPLAAYKNGADTWIYATMRRGGRSLYAFDVSNPAGPILKWKKGSSDTGLDGIGQTWSTPIIFKASGYASGGSPLMIMGGGYDTCEDADPNTCTSSNKGNHIYVMDAETGALLETFDTDRGVVGDVLVVTDSAGLAQYAYAADLGGNIYRISGVNANTPIATTDPSPTGVNNWTITKIASLGCDTTASCTANRKFMFKPSVVDDNGSFALMLGSGDREKPLSSYTAAAGVTNYFFMVKDKPTDPSWLTSECTDPSHSNAPVLCLSSLQSIALDSADPTQANLDAKKGWYLGLKPKEQVVTAAITVFDVVTFHTHQPAVPAPNSCVSNLGTTNVYNIYYANAGGANGTDLRYQRVIGDGLPPSPVAGMVTINGETVPFCIGCGTVPLGGGSPPSPSTVERPKSKVYWYIQQ